jgi:HlyD family secretion protein
VNKKIIRRVLAIGVPLLLLVVLLVGCTAKKQTTTTTQVTATAKKGNLALDITAVGNLAYSQSEELSFDTNGTVSEVLVNIGDSVTKGQVLARLDMTVWQQNITNLESTLVSKQQSLTQAQQSLTNANRTVANKENAVTVAQQAVDDAKYNVTVKERAVTQTQITIANAEISYKQLQQQFYNGTGDAYISERLNLAAQSLELTKAGLDDANRAVAQAQRAVTTAENALESAKLDVQDAQTAVTIAQTGVTKAQQDIVNAQTALDDANATHPELTAPFDGLITAINTQAGSTIYKGGAIVTIVDPNKFKADVLVGETDISNVKVNGDATVELDAITGISLPATVTSISPTSTNSQGVVSYKVTVEIASQQVTQQSSTQPNSTSQFTPGQLPSGFTPGQLPSGITQGQLPSGFTPGTAGMGQGQNQTGTQTTGTSQSVQLRQGLTATVSIIIQQRTNVIYIPNQAIKTVSGNATVNVIKDGVTTERSIKTGMATSKYTEVTEGLTEGEQVVYTKSSSSSSSSSTFGAGGGGGFMVGP